MKENRHQFAILWVFTPCIFYLFVLFLAQNDFFSPRTYVLNLQPLTWYEANQYCQTNGGHLAKVYDISTIPDLQLTEILTQ